MTDSAVLQVLIGLALVFAVFSVAVSRLNETVLAALGYRGRRLETELRRLTGSPGATSASPAAAESGTPRDLVAELLDGPLRSLRVGGSKEVADVAAQPPVGGWRLPVLRAHNLRLPAYLPSLSFARGLLDLVEPPVRALLHQISPDVLTAAFPDTVSADQRAQYAQAYRAAYDGLTEQTAAALHAAMPTSYEAGVAVTSAIISLLEAQPTPTPLLPLSAEIARLPLSPLRTALTGMAARAGTDRDRLVAELAGWYDSSMDRLSGWYKRRVGRFMVVYALLLTVAFNVDVVGLTTALWQDSAVRAVAVAQAEDEARSSPGTDRSGSGDGIVVAVRDIGALQLPFGWTGAHAGAGPRAVPRDAEGWLLKILGWLIAVAALSVGAPFWFDLLGRLVNMRATGPKPDSVAT